MFDIRSAAETETGAALRLVFRCLPDDDRRNRVSVIEPLIRAGGEETPVLLVHISDGSVAGAILVQSLVGKAGALWPPQVDSTVAGADRLEDELLQRAVEHLRTCGSIVIQAVLSAEEESSADVLISAGFTRPTELVYLKHDLNLSEGPIWQRRQLQLVPYAEDLTHQFHHVLANTYQQTQDFPELNGRRTLEDILAGLKATGFDASRAWLAFDSDAAAGVLVLNVASSGSWELAYVGIVPQLRGRGLGTELVRHAIAATKKGGAHELILSVDVRNVPALRLYQSLEFEPFDRRAVYLLLD
jgi:ribosomal protein S18 acetylase RimI-like enzyme